MKNLFKAVATVVIMMVAGILQAQAQTKQEITKMQAELKQLTVADQLVTN